MDEPLPSNLCDEWSTLLKNKPGRGNDLYDCVFDNNTLFPLQRKRETEKMIAKARTIRPRVVAEIGADKGGSFFHWVCGLETVERALAIEIRGTPYGNLFADAFPEVDFKFIPDSSYSTDTVLSVTEWLNGDKFDCVFLDGDKSEFMRDFNLYLPMVRRGGMIMMHDINRGGKHPAAPPATVFDNIADGGRFVTERIIDTSEAVEAAQRDADKVALVNSYDAWLRFWADSSCGVGVVYI